MEQCKALREYASFIQMVRVYYKETKDEMLAIRKALEEAINQNYLDGYFQKEKEEVFMTTLFEVNRDIYENDLREEGREQGREQERKKIVFAMYQSGIPMKQIASIIKIDMEELEEMLLDK